MIRKLPPVLLVLAAMSGCGWQTEPQSSHTAVLDDAAFDRARLDGVDPDLIVIVDLPGYELAGQSIGGIGEEGFGASYVSPGGKQVQLRVDRGTFDDALCTGTPIADARPPDAPVRCDHDEVGWYRQGGGRHEYTTVEGDHYIRLNGTLADVDRATLKAAIAGARHVTGTATPLPPPSPVERGDLPARGDGAPDNRVGPGG